MMKQAFFFTLMLLGGALLAQESVAPCPDWELRTEYDSTHRRYHFYQVETPLCSLDAERGLTPDAAFALMCSDVSLVAPVAGRQTGPVRPCEPVEVKVAFTRRNPIITAVDSGALKLVNYSLPGHFLHPGKVERQVVARAGQIWMITRSWGEGRMPRLDERKADQVWGAVDARLRARLLAEEQ